jgi:predicted RND superfamily exporter protein
MVFVAAFGLVALSAAGIRQLRFDADVLSLLPRDGRAVPAFRTFLRHFGSMDHLYVVFSAPEGYSIADYDAEIERAIQRLRDIPEIESVDAGLASRRDLRWLADRQLLLLEKDRLAEALSRFDGDGMRAAIASRRELLSVPSPDLADLVRNDPLGLTDLTSQQLAGPHRAATFGAPRYVTPDGDRRLIIAQPREPPFNTDFSRRLWARLETLRAELARRDVELPDEPRPAVDVEFAGGHRIALETEALVRKESITNTVGSLAVILPLLFVVFRSFWLVAVGPIPTGASLLLVLAVLGLLGTTLSAAATASAAMLFGLGIDGVVLLYVAYTLAVAEGTHPDAAVERLGGPASSMLLGMWTTAATFYGLAWVDFPSLEQLGMLIGHSMVLCGILTLVFVAACLPHRPPSRPIRPLKMRRLARFVERRAPSILIAALVTTIGLGCAALWLRINPSLDRLRSVTAGARLLDDLNEAFGLPRDMQVIVAAGRRLEDLLVANERLVDSLRTRLPNLTVQAPSALLPPEATQSERASLVEQRRLSPTRVEAELTAAARAEGFREGSFDPFRRRLPGLLDASNRLTYDGYVQNGLADVIRRFVVPQPDGWLLATYVFPQDAEEMQTVEAIADSTDPSATLTGLPLVNRELADRFVPQFAKGLAIGSIVVVCLVIAAFRDWWLSLLSFVPTVIGLIWAAGLLALTRTELDLFALFAVVTFVGIGVDYGIHLVHRYKESGDAGAAIEQLAPVILVAAAITFIGYGTLVTSGYPPLRSIGVVSAISVTTLAVASVAVLPAMLCWRAGSRQAGHQPCEPSL